jgi:cytochrome c
MDELKCRRVPSDERRVQATKRTHLIHRPVAAASRGECDIAPVHLIDQESGLYNVHLVTPGLTLVPGWRRMQGMLFRPGDRRFEGHTAQEALATILPDPAALMVNRNAGAGTRVLIEKLLYGARPPGYANQPKSHNAVAVAIAQGRADWGVAVEPVAKLYGLASCRCRRNITISCWLKAAGTGLPCKHSSRPCTTLRHENASARSACSRLTDSILSSPPPGGGRSIAAAGIRGSVAVIERKARKLARTLVGPGLPVWSVAFFSDSRTLLTGGADRTIRRWDAVSGEPVGGVVVGAPDDPLAAYANDPGAQVFRACVACHTLSPGEGNKAGPSLAGIFGRKIATLPGYRYSEALKHMSIVWTPQTVAKMFEVGPMTYTPGTKMPEQKIGSAEDRMALVEFLAKATKK